MGLTNVDRFLLKTLGRTDAIHWVCRDDFRVGQSPIREVLHDAQVDYASGGLVPVATEKRWILSLEKSGHIVRIERNQRSVGVRLTYEADARCRRSCGLPPLADSVALLERLRHLQAAAEWPGVFGYGKAATDHGAWVWEWMLAGLDGETLHEIYHGESKRHLYDQQEAMLPLLVRGLVRSNSAVTGHAGYQVTETGWTFEAPIDLAGDTDVPVTDAANNAYMAAFEREQERLRACSPSDATAINAIPLPATGMPIQQETTE